MSVQRDRDGDIIMTDARPLTPAEVRSVLASLFPSQSSPAPIATISPTPSVYPAPRTFPSTISR